MCLLLNFWTNLSLPSKLSSKSGSTWSDSVVAQPPASSAELWGNPLSKSSNNAPSSRGPPPGLGSQQKTPGTNSNSSNGWIGSGLGGPVGRGGSSGVVGGGSNWSGVGGGGVSGVGGGVSGSVNPNASWNSTWLLLKNLTAQVPFTVHLAAARLAPK